MHRWSGEVWIGGHYLAEEQPKEILHEFLLPRLRRLITMKFRQISGSPRTFILIFETRRRTRRGSPSVCQGAEAIGRELKAVGALSSVRLGWFSWEGKRYEPSVTLDEQVEFYRSSATLHSRTESRSCTLMR